MTDKVVGHVTIHGTDAQVNALTPFITTATDLLGRRIDLLDLEVRARDKMPVAFVKDNGTVVHAEGHWSDRLRRMLVADDLFGDGLALKRDKTLGHEFVHVLYSDWFTKWHRRQLLPLLTPEADNWFDETIGDEWMGYVAAPTEGFACWGSAALFGWDKPAYSTLYLRRIRTVDFPHAKQITLAPSP